MQRCASDTGQKRLAEKREQLSLNLEEGEAPLEELRLKLEELLDKRLSVDEELKVAQTALEDADRELYQTVYSTRPGAVAERATAECARPSADSATALTGSAPALNPPRALPGPPGAPLPG